MLYRNIKTIAEVIFKAALTQGDISENPVVKIKFKLLWSLSDTEQATVEQSRAQTSLTKAQTAQVYCDIGALDPSEVRLGLAKDKEFDIEKLLDDVPESDLMAGWDEPIEPQSAPMDTPEQPSQEAVADAVDTSESVGVIIINDTGDSVLCGIRSDNGMVGGAGGHIQAGESPEQAAVRETQEEFGITPGNLKHLGQITNFANGKYGEPHVFLCTQYDGEPAESEEMSLPFFVPISDFNVNDPQLYPPFAESMKMLADSRSDRERDYAKEYREYHSKPEQVKNRTKRNAARRELGLEKGDPREADHIKPLSKGGGNSSGNLRAVSQKTNREKGSNDE
jgi:8-oxo-dGTP pyrophosphatase MutT (NUDIX family)